MRIYRSSAWWLLLLLSACRRSEAPGAAPDALPPFTLDAAPAIPAADAADAPADAAAREQAAPVDPREELTSRTCWRARRSTAERRPAS